MDQEPQTSSVERKDFYTILSLPRDAKPPQIKARFRDLVRERHPDRFHGEGKAEAELEFQNITEAFNVLMDPTRRRQHDLELDRPTQKARFDPDEAVRVYMNRGIRAYKEGKYPEAADYFERATQSGPENPKAWHHLALTCSKEARWLPKAQVAIAQACELRPTHVPYLKLAGKIFTKSGMTARAKQYYNQALREVGGMDPSIRRALDALGGAAPAKEQRAQKRQEKGKGGLFRKIW